MSTKQIFALRKRAKKELENTGIDVENTVNISLSEASENYSAGTDKINKINHIRQAYLDPALENARILMVENSQDTWHILAFTLTIIDMIKLELDLINLDGRNMDTDKVFQYFNEIEQYRIDIIREITQETNTQKTPSLSLSLGWAINKTLQVLCSHNNNQSNSDQGNKRNYSQNNSRNNNPGNIDGGKVIQLLRLYGRLNRHPQPSLLHSNILRHAVKASEVLPDFISFVCWWNPEFLMEQDYKRYQLQNSDKVFDSLVEKLIKALYKAALKSNSADKNRNTERIEFAARFIESCLDKFSDQEWFPYYYAKLLIKQGKTEQSREFFISVARQKQNEFWAWEALADTFESTDRSASIACLCRALSCPLNDESFAVNVHRKLGYLLKDTGEYQRAKAEFQRVISIRESNGWKISQDILNIQNQAWFMETESSSDNHRFYRSHSGTAEELINKGISWIDGNISAHLKATDTRKATTTVIYRDENNSNHNYKVFFKTASFPAVADLPVGSPVKIQLITVRDRQKIFAIDKRDGKSWDILPKKEFSGKIRLIEGGSGRFGFIEDIYIPGHLIRPDISNHDSLFGISISEWNENRKTYGWKAITLLKDRGRVC